MRTYDPTRPRRRKRKQAKPTKEQVDAAVISLWMSAGAVLLAAALLALLWAVGTATPR